MLAFFISFPIFRQLKENGIYKFKNVRHNRGKGAAKQLVPVKATQRLPTSRPLQLKT